MRGWALLICGAKLLKQIALVCRNTDYSQVALICAQVIYVYGWQSTCKKYRLKHFGKMIHAWKKYFFDSVVQWFHGSFLMCDTQN